MSITSTSKIWQPDSILHTSADQSVVVLDIPRSIEEAQVEPGQPIHRHIHSSQPPVKPWDLPEPKGSRSRDSAVVVPPAAAIAELMTLETVSAALDNAQAEYHGVWCLPRQRMVAQISDREQQGARAQEVATIESRKENTEANGPGTNEDSADPPPHYVPTKAHYISGTIEKGRTELIQRAPTFDLIVLDPPWPSRSAKRKKSGNSYAVVNNISEAHGLLSSIPIRARLKPNGIVAIWITNKAAVQDLLMAPEHGLFAQWGLEPVGEWIWLKVTSAGDPIFNVQSQWRKPWERLLFARPRQHRFTRSVDDYDITHNTSRRIPTKVILAVPDLHSRKPNLRGLLQGFLPSDYEALEIFARNLTAGWWSWGNEVLLFQGREHWVDMDAEKCDLADPARLD